MRWRGMLRPRALREPRFIADVHLAKLARHLRMAGFDTLLEPDWDDDAIVERAAAERRTILTRDKAMLRRSAVERGYFVRNVHGEAQLAEVVRALQLVDAKNDEEWQTNGEVKSQMMRLNPSFKEKPLGYKSFTEFLESRAAAGAIEIKPKSKANDRRLKLR